MKSYRNGTTNHDEALRYPFDDAAKAMANELARGKYGQTWEVRQCQRCKGYHLEHGGEMLAVPGGAKKRA